MYCNVNGTRLYYETFGEGSPVILLHGNGEDHKIFDKLIPLLAKDSKVYAVDSTGHGKSEGNNLSYSQIASDIIDFIKINGIEKPLLYGFSDGGIVGIMIAYMEPTLLSRLIVSGANVNTDGLSRWFLFGTKIAYFFSKSPRLKMIINEPDISDEELLRIKIPVLILAGKKDIIRQEHTQQIAKKIKSSKLKILGGENHGSYVVHSEKLYPYFFEE